MVLRYTVMDGSSDEPLHGSVHMTSSHSSNPTLTYIFNIIKYLKHRFMKFDV